ncbi:MAG: hypothetical protein K2Y33_04675 [Mycolicibacterium frederiksbergense]|nr:hypothetical protein [Mycolicibacterium frederiksbergense]
MTTTADLLAELQERRQQQAHERAAAWCESQKQMRHQLVIRGEVGYDDVVTTYRTLRQLGLINLDDLKVPPGFNLLPDGEVGSVNSDTAEWQFWSGLNHLRDNAEHLSDVLMRAADELKVAGRWNKATA